MSVLSLALALQLTKACAPTVAPETWLSIAHHESGFDPLVIRDNTTGQAYVPSTLSAAVTFASSLIAAGHSLDLGAAQIHWQAGHLQRRGLPLAAPFDPCVGFRVGSEVLTDCYRHTPGTDEQVRLRAALGCYNGDRSGAYARLVYASAEHIVPAIRLAGDGQGAGAPSLGQVQLEQRQDIEPGLVQTGAGSERDPLPSRPPAPAQRPNSSGGLIQTGAGSQRDPLPPKSATRKPQASGTSSERGEETRKQ